MMKNLLFANTLLVSVLLVTCGNGKGDSTETRDWESTQYDTVNNFDGVSMTVKEGSISPTKLTVIFENNSNKQGVYGEYFSLEKEIEGDWYQVPTIIDEYAFSDIGYELGPSEIEEFTIDWDSLYGSMDTGKYRIVKDISDFRGAGDYDKYYLAAQFIID